MNTASAWSDRSLERYYPAYINATGNNFASQYGFKPVVTISREDINNGFKMCVEVSVPGYVIKDIYEETRREVLKNTERKSQTQAL